MKRLVYIMAMALLLWPGCSAEQKADSQNEHKEAEAARHERQMYQDKIEKELRNLDQEIDTLKTKIGSHNKVEGKRLIQEMAELDRKRETAQKDFETLKNSSQEAWRDMRTGVDAAMEDLEMAYEQASSHFK